MSQCSRCNNNLPANARFCNCCGLSQTSTSIGAANQLMSKAHKTIHPVSVIRKVQSHDTAIPQHSSSHSEHVSNKSNDTSTKHTLSQKYIPFTLPTVPSHNQVARLKSMDTLAQPASTLILQPYISTEPSQQIHTSSHTSSNNESIIATSKAAQRWRQSWQERQQREQVSAVKVSRGQANVTAPFSAPLKTGHKNFVDKQMGHLYTDEEETKTRAKYATQCYWLTIAILLSLIIGLLIFILLSL